jgi:hypothetical protein
LLGLRGSATVGNSALEKAPENNRAEKRFSGLLAMLLRQG